MNDGVLKIYTKDNIYYGEIINLKNTYLSGKYLPATPESPPEYPIFEYELGIAECYDIEESDIIEDICIDELTTPVNTEYSTEVEIVKTYWDFNNLCRVIEFR